MVQFCLKISLTDKLIYTIEKNSSVLIDNAEIDLDIAGQNSLQKELVGYSMQTNTRMGKITPILEAKNKTITEEYNEFTFMLNHYDIIFRAYDDGVAYRIRTKFDEKITVVNELVNIGFKNNYSLLFPEEESFISHQERIFSERKLNEISVENFASLPVLVNCDNIKVLLCESDLRDYPGLYYRGNSNNFLTGKYPSYVIKESMNYDRNPVVEERAEFIARREGKGELPWRVFIIAEHDKDLLENELVYKLAAPLAIENTDWIKPGKVAWDWWNFNNISPVDFRAGVNTETYKYFIDFASKNNIEYIILDEGWYVLGDLMKMAPDMDVPELISYAKSKNVGIILWVIWKTLEDQFDEAMNQFEKWGVKGLKVDFMQRDDQWMVNWYHKITEECAKRKFLVDFHGAYIPRGLRRAYPNLITREGVQGLEHYKWESEQGPDHELTLPFTRQVVGPMDFTPGAMINATKDAYHAFFTRPMSKGTRCHQLAMYVVYESPLQMLADAPTNYEKNPECLEFLSKVPTVWDRTVAIEGKVGDYVVIARQKNDTWYIGAMTDWTQRDFEVDLGFLDKGNYDIIIYKDGLNADRNAEDFKMETGTVSSNSTIKIKMAPGGGWVAVLKKNSFGE